MFSEDMFDACVIELDKLIMGINPERIDELWRITSINKTSEHFVILYDNAAHLCTCLTLINRGLVCRHFFAVMLVSSTAKFNIRLVPQRWYTDSIMEEDPCFQDEKTISAISGQEFGTVEHDIEVNFSHLETIRGNYVFTKEVREEMTQKQQYGKGFGIMKKTLNLAIATGRTEELYELHMKLAKEMESEIVGQVKNGDNITEFASTISNPIGIKKKGRKPKYNVDRKGKKKVIESNQSNKENSRNSEDFGHVDDRKGKKRATSEYDQNNTSCEEVQHKKVQKILQDNRSNDLTNGETSTKRVCGICNEKGHNARTCAKGKTISS
jgi:hypothetical protein